MADPSQILAPRASLLDYQRLQQEFDMKKQQAAMMAMKLQSGQDLPAALQLANEYQAAIQAGDLNRANTIAAFAKTVDKNVQMGADGSYQPLAGLPNALGAIEGAKAGRNSKRKRT